MENKIEVEKFLGCFTTTESNLDVYDKLLKKFEIYKKVFVEYDSNFKKNISDKEISLAQYQQLIVCFLGSLFITKDIRYYNTALKIGDKINFTIPFIDLDLIYESE